MGYHFTGADHRLPGSRACSSKDGFLFVVASSSGQYVSVAMPLPCERYSSYFGDTICSVVFEVTSESSIALAFSML